MGTYPVTLHRRDPAGQLRYLADQLDAGQDPLAVCLALIMVAEGLGVSLTLVENTAGQAVPPSEAAWQHYYDMVLSGRPVTNVDQVRSGWKSGYEAGWHERGTHDRDLVAPPPDPV